MQVTVPLFTPRKEVSFGEKGRLASPTETGSMVSSLDSPASSIASYNVKVAAPAKIPTDGPIFFTVVVSSAARGDAEWIVERRFSAFDALQTELWWRRLGKPALGATLPAKLPPPGRDAALLAQRAAGCETWANAVLEQPDCHSLASVIAFFGLEAMALERTPSLSIELDRARSALTQLQAIGRESFLDLGSASPSSFPPRSALRSRRSASRSAKLALFVGVSLVAAAAAGFFLAPELFASEASAASASTSSASVDVAGKGLSLPSIFGAAPSPSALALSIASAVMAYNPFAAQVVVAPPPPPPKRAALLMKPLQAVGKFAKAATKPIWRPIHEGRLKKQAQKA